MVTKCYVSGRPKDCRDCRFWRNKKVGCVLGKQNCCYLISLAMEDMSLARSQSGETYEPKTEVVTVDGI